MVWLQARAGDRPAQCMASAPSHATQPAAFLRNLQCGLSQVNCLGRQIACLSATCSAIVSVSVLVRLETCASQCVLSLVGHNPGGVAVIPQLHITYIHFRACCAPTAR